MSGLEKRNTVTRATDSEHADLVQELIGSSKHRSTDTVHPHPAFHKGTSSYIPSTPRSAKLPDSFRLTH